MAHTAMREEKPGHILQSTALIHETYLRLIPSSGTRFNDRKHFFRVAAKAMRHVLAEEARKRLSAKRGFGRKAVSIHGLELVDRSGSSGVSFEEVEALDRSLDRLEAQVHNQRICAVVELRFFVGLTYEQTADVLEISKETVRRDWEFAKTWLRRAMRGNH